MVEGTVFLRLADASDESLLLAWRNTPIIYEGYYTQNKPIGWEENEEWHAKRNQDRRQFVIMLKQDTSLRAIGGVTIAQRDYWSPEIGFSIGETTLWGQGYGREAVRLGLEWLKGEGYKHCHTTVLKKNERSIRLLKSLGFEYLGEARKGEIWMQREL